jgi:histidinol-phosphate aminotransferase
LVLDEAYVDFASAHGLGLLSRTPRLIITRSLSKSYSLAGIRFGFAVGDPAVIRELYKIKDSYNCDALSLIAATAALEDQDYLRCIRERIWATRRRLEQALAELGFFVTPSEANFVWCRWPGRPLRPLYVALKERRILVRWMSYPNYGEGLRISVGTDAEIDALLLELRQLV